MGYDVATERRKRAFSEALKHLMLEKPLSKVTISDIVQDCGVNRKTFYYHFEDVYDLLKWTLEQEAIEVVKQFDLLVNTEQAVSFVIDYVENNQHILKCAYDTMGRNEMRRFFYSDFIQVISTVIEQAERQAELQVNPTFKNFLADFYAEALAGILINMFTGDLPYSRVEVQSNIIFILKISIPAALSQKAETE